jgi:hypothetical protein
MSQTERNEIVLTKELLKRWGIPSLIPDELLPMGLMGLFEAPISLEAKVGVLLYEEILGGRGLVYVVARAARRACTETGWDHPDSLRALDLCDQEEVSKEELGEAAWVVSEAPPMADDAPSYAAWEAAYGTARVAWTVAVDTSARTKALEVTRAAVSTAPSEKEERKAQLEDCREWLTRRV